MTHQNKRQHKVSWLMARIIEAAATGKMIKEDALVSEACLTFGAGRRYVKEILSDLAITEKIVREFGDLYPKDVHDAVKLQEKEDLNNDEILEKL